METPNYVSLPFVALPALHGQRTPQQLVPSDAPLPTAMVRLGECWYNDARTFESLQNMPNSYTGAAREGVYVPYRLSQTHQEWQNGSDVVMHVANNESALLDGNPWAATTPTSSLAVGPYGLASLDSTTWGQQIHKRADCGVVHISFRQLNKDASLMFYFRAGWEFQVLPGRPLCSFQHSSPESDPRAIQTYFKISRELKDAYPCDYNDLGKILGTIWDVAKGVIGTVFPAARIPLAAASMLKGLIAPSPTTDQALLGSKEPVPDLTSAAQKERV